MICTIWEFLRDMIRVTESNVVVPQLNLGLHRSFSRPAIMQCILTWQHLGKSEQSRIISDVAGRKQKRSLFLVQTCQFSFQFFVIWRVARNIACSSSTRAMFVHGFTGHSDMSFNEIVVFFMLNGKFPR